MQGAHVPDPHDALYIMPHYPEQWIICAILLSAAAIGLYSLVRFIKTPRHTRKLDRRLTEIFPK